MSHFGCVYNCSFCCTSVTRKSYGAKAYKEFWLARRPVENMIEEAKLFLKFNTKEVSFEDDDVLYGTHKNGDGTEWLSEFRDAWKKEINLPMYANVTPQTVVRSTDEALRVLADLADTVQMGVQTTGGDSSKLFNRHFQDEDQVTEAVKILSFRVSSLVPLGPVKINFPLSTLTLVSFGIVIDFFPSLDIIIKKPYK